MPKKILVTGATGYIARHIVLRLLESGFEVVGTIRSAGRDGELREALAPRLEDPSGLDRYRSVELDLESDAGWDEAMQGIDALIHTASPFPVKDPRDPDEIIRPAVEGTQRVLGAARRAGVARVILTSSSEAIVYQPPLSGKKLLSEIDWSNTDLPEVSTYGRSKTLAERAAWDIAGDPDAGMALTVLNPVLVIGPPLGDSYGTSVQVIAMLLGGKYPMLPRAGFAIVDVQDVAEAHVRALEQPETAGHRIILVDRFIWMTDMARLLQERFPDRRVPTRVAPDWAVRLLGRFNASVRLIVPTLGRRFDLSNFRMRQTLGISPRDARDAIVETGAYLAERNTRG